MLWRLIILALLVWLVWRWWRAQFKAPRQQPPAMQTMVRCARCGLHVPEQEALRESGQYFCSEQCRKSL